jgi:hypothetical protein
LPERACADLLPSFDCALLGGFNRSDYEGWSILDGVNERMSWATDLAGSGKVVAQLEVYGDDDADQYGGTRANIYESAARNCNGCDGWFAYGYYFPVGFQYPDQWLALMQNFEPSRPVQTIELRSGASCGSAAPRSHLCWGERQTPDNTTVVYHDLGQVNEGHWSYIVARIKFRNTATGEIKVWRSDDRLPDVTQPPSVDVSNILTLYSGTTASRSDVYLYRGASSHSQHQIVDVCGFHRAADAVRAMTLPNCP